MKSSSPKPTGTLLALASLTMVASVPRDALAVQNLKVGEAFPGFSLPRADRLTGEYTLEETRGKPAVVMFWRPRQELSLEALRDLQAIGQEVGGAKLAIVAVDASGSTAQAVQSALAGESVSFPLLLDPKRVLYGKIGLIVAPTTLVLDAKGTLRFVLASHPRSYHQVIRARLRYLLGDITEQQMNQEIEPATLKIDHDLAAAWRMYNLGRRLESEGKSREALSVFEETVTRYPSLAEARCALGFMKFSEGDMEAAAKHFQAALAHAPTSTLARLGKAAVLARTGQPDSAEAILLALLGQASEAARVRYELGRIYQSRGQADRAITFFQDALATIFPEPSQTDAAGPSSPVTPGPATAPAPAPAAALAPATTTAPATVPVLASASPGPAQSVPGAATATEPATPPAADSLAAPETGRVPGGTASIEPIALSADAKYIGVKGCKKCHFQQWKSWQETKMALAFDLLKAGTRSEIKQARSLDPQKDYTRDPSCLACHTTGHGQPGGYPAVPPGDAPAVEAAKELTGIGCEACHGAGDGYVVAHKQILDKRRKYTQQELYDAGQYPVNERVCAACHNEKGPCIARGMVFDYEKRKTQGTHKHYELQLRAK